MTFSRVQRPTSGFLVRRGAREVPVAYERWVVKQGAPSFGYATASEADQLAIKAARRSFVVEAREYGAFTFTRSLNGRTIAAVELTPFVRPQGATDSQVKDLHTVLSRERSMRLCLDAGGYLRAASGLVSVSDVATQRLFKRGWLSMTGAAGCRVTVSLAGRVVLAWHETSSAAACREAMLAAVGDLRRKADEAGGV